jgi:hypothetical protein
MEQCTRNHRLKEAQCEAGPNVGALLGPDPLTEALRGKIREALVTLFDEELTQVLGAAKGERLATRCGYRHGAKARELTTGLGKVQLALPRGRLFTPEGGRVWVRGFLSQPDGGLRIEMEDTGPGIAAEEHERIFVEFQQAPVAPAADRPDGAGPDRVSPR